MSGRLILVAHGSRDPRAAQVLGALRDAVAARLAEIDSAVHVLLAWIELGTPLVAEVLAAGEPGDSPPVVVPLLLSRGTHTSRDLPGHARPPLGPDPLLTRVLLDRIADAGIGRGRPLVLAATGSAQPAGRADVAAQARLLADAWGADVAPGFVSHPPTVADAVVDLGERAGRPPAVVSYFLAPGRLPDSVQAQTEHLALPAPHPSLVELVLARYRGAAPVGVTRMGL